MPFLLSSTVNTGKGLRTKPSTGGKNGYNRYICNDKNAELSNQELPEIEAKCYGLRINWFKLIFIYYILNVLTLGVIYLLGRWYCQVMVKLAFVRCGLNEATTILIKDSDNKYTICPIHEVVVEVSRDELLLKPCGLKCGRKKQAASSASSSSSSSSDENGVDLQSGSENELLLHETSRITSEIVLEESELPAKRVQPSPAAISLEECEEDIEGLTSYTGNRVKQLKYFEYHEERFILDNSCGLFCMLNGLSNVKCNDLLNKFHGYDEYKRKELKKIYGSNIINIVVKNYFQLLIDEAINPFYFFQIFSVAIWCLDDYFLYATCVIIISSVSIMFTMFETRQQMITLKAIADGKENNGDRAGNSSNGTGSSVMRVTVLKPDGEEEELSYQDLVPGDILLIPPEGFIMPCDAVVTQGTCIVNESMLTGESVPVHKTGLLSSDDEYDPETFKRNTLFCGTKVIQTRFYAGHNVSCVVVRTGYNTVKGSLIRSILFPKQVSFSFYKDSVKFVAILFFIAVLGMVYCAYVYFTRNASWNVLIIRVLDLMTIAVPPALPAVMTVGSYYAQRRLKGKRIFCTSPDRINFAGKLKLLCFDKTGTLTEGGLDLWCVVPFSHERGMFEDPVGNPNKELPTESNLLQGMACCHSLTFINGELVGDPLDVKMFESTNWDLEEPFMYQSGTEKHLVPIIMKKDAVEIGLIRQFEFTPQLQRMSVVVKQLNNSSGMKLFCKGSPEKVLPLCINSPSNYECILDSFTIKGYRVLAMAWKPVVGYKRHQLQRVARAEIETELYFSGFIVMQNSLKPVTKPVISKLIKGGIRCVMVTGDNMLTAISVARECNMIPPCDKAIIVEMSEEGQINFKLSAHHYEPAPVNNSEPPYFEIPSSTSSSGNFQTDHGDYDNQAGTGSGRWIRIGVGSDAEEDGSGDNNMPLYSCNDQRWSDTVQAGDANGNARKLLRNSTADTFIDIDNLVEIPSPQNKGSIRQLLSVLDSEPQKYHFVMTGRVWSLLVQFCPKSILQRILVKGTVFSRMSPENKRQLVEYFQELGYCVGMCGDGANDCAALKMAHVGISLSDAEASVAAPFTSKVCDISCVPTLIMEGRCALVTSFGMFKYMALYSMIQLCSVLILYSNKTNLSDAQFLFIDLGIITSTALAMGRTQPHTKIANKRPMANLLSIQNLISLLLQTLVACGLQIFTILYLQSQVWYEPIRLDNSDEDMRTSWESTAVFSVSCFQYIFLSMAFSKGKPFRKPFYTNWALICLYLVLSAAILTMMIYPVGQIASIFELIPITSNYEKQEFRLKLLIIPLVNLIASLLCEFMISNTSCLKKTLRKFGYHKSKYLYDEVLETVEKDTSWPPVNS